MKKKKYFLSLLAGAFGSLAFAPIYFFPAALISLSAFYFFLEKTKDKKEIFWLGFSFGFGHFLVGVYWIAISLLVDVASFGWLIPFALTLIPSALALYLALFALLYKFLITKFELHASYQKILIFAFCWLVFEVLRSVLFTGFPWNLLGYIWMFDVYPAQIASVFGIYGLSFFAVLISLLPVLFFHPSKPKKFSFVKKSDKIFAIILVAAFVGNVLYGHFRVTRSELVFDPNLKLRLVQGNIKQEMKWDAAEKYRNLLRHIELTNSENLDDVAAVIWSETSVPYPIGDNADLLTKLREAMPENGVLITGAVRLKYLDSEKTQIKNAWNSVFTLNKNGVVNAYDKHHLVPFGEYIPLQKYLPFVEKITEGSIGFSEGDGVQTVATKAFSFSPLVCYEAIFSDETVNKNSRPDLLINLTNDAWFGKSSGPYQHFDMARMRAIENGVPLARVANTGITAFVDPFGKVIAKINLNQSGIIDVNLVKNLDPTIYQKYSHLPLIMLLLALTPFLIFVPKNRHATRQDNSNRHSSS